MECSSILTILEAVMDSNTHGVRFDYSQFPVGATHPGPHLDERAAFWLAMVFARFNPQAYIQFVSSGEEVENLPGNTLVIGIAQSDFDEHAPGGRMHDTSALSLMAQTLGVDKHPQLELLLTAIHQGDTQGDSHPMTVDALLKVVTHAQPNNQELHREVGRRLYRMFEAVTGLGDLDYGPIPIVQVDGIDSCETADELFERWRCQVTITVKEENITEAANEVAKLWRNQRGLEQPLHLKHVCSSMLAKFGPQEAYSFLDAFLTPLLHKQIDIRGYGRCHRDWRKARRHGFTSKTGLRVAVMETGSAYMLTHLRMRHDLKRTEEQPDIVVIYTKMPGNHPQVAVIPFSEKATAMRDQLVTAVARREFRLSRASNRHRERFSRELEELLAQGTSRSLPGPADNWLFFPTGRDDRRSWMLLNGTHTRPAQPTMIATRNDWMDLLQDL